MSHSRSTKPSIPPQITDDAPIRLVTLIASTIVILVKMFLDHKLIHDAIGLTRDIVIQIFGR